MAADDPIMPYLKERGKTIDDLTTQEAQEIKSDIMNKLKTRILNRGDIIHKRLEQERQALKNEKNELAKKADTPLEPEKQKEHEMRIKDVEFRVRILENRACKFQMNSLQKYTDMNQQLSIDLKIGQNTDKE